MPTRLLIISHEAIGPVMSGPAIRYWQIAHALAGEVEVTLAAPGAPALTSVSVQLAGYDRAAGAELRALSQAADVLLVSGFLLYTYPFLAAWPRPMVVDVYDPFILETMEIHAARPLAEQAGIHRVNLSVLNAQLQRGDFFLCASERQRDFWLGMLMALGRVNPHTFQADVTVRQLVDVVTFGLADPPPAPSGHPLKGTYPGIGPDDRVIYWGGGVWEWFDPLTAIRAVGEAARTRPEVKLFFAGVRHDNPDVPPVRMVQAAQALSAELGLTGRSVFFNSWVPYAERHAWLQDADLGISLHFDHLETRYSYRTRLLDYIWTGLPMVLTRGDTLGEIAAQAGLARLVAPGDHLAAAQAMLELLDAPGGKAAFQPAAAALAETMRWARVVEPLRQYLRAPRRAADWAPPVPVTPPGPGLLLAAWRSLTRRGPAGFVQDVRHYLKR